MTTFPLLVAASKSTLSTPIPALPITFSLAQDSITFLVAFVADRTTRPSHSCNSLIKAASSKPFLTMASIPLSVNIRTASALSLSAIRTLNIYCFIVV